MNKFLRIVSTLVVGIGLILLFVYLSYSNSVSKAQLLENPSYYTLQNYWYLLVAGCGCVAFSIISSFLAWNKKLDEKVEILPNAVAAEKTQLMDWLTGSSLDTGSRGRKQKASAMTETTQKDAVTDQTLSSCAAALQTEEATFSAWDNTQAATERSEEEKNVLTLSSEETVGAEDAATVLADEETLLDRN